MKPVFPTLTLNSFGRAFAHPVDSTEFITDQSDPTDLDHEQGDSGPIQSGPGNSISHAAGNYTCTKPLVTGNAFQALYVGLVFGIKELYRQYNSKAKIREFVANSALIAAQLQPFAGENPPASDQAVIVKLIDGRQLKLTQQMAHGSATGVVIELEGEKQQKIIDGTSFQDIYRRLVDDAKKNKHLYVSDIWLYTTRNGRIDHSKTRSEKLYTDDYWSVTLSTELLSELMNADSAQCQSVDTGSFMPTRENIDGYLRKLRRSGFLSDEQCRSLSNNRVKSFIHSGELAIATVLTLSWQQHDFLRDPLRILGKFYDHNLLSVNWVITGLTRDDYFHLGDKNAVILESLLSPANSKLSVKNLADYFKLNDAGRRQFRRHVELTRIQSLTY